MKELKELKKVINDYFESELKIYKNNSEMVNVLKDDVADMMTVVDLIKNKEFDRVERFMGKMDTYPREILYGFINSFK